MCVCVCVCVYARLAYIKKFEKFEHVTMQAPIEILLDYPYFFGL